MNEHWIKRRVTSRPGEMEFDEDVYQAVQGHGFIGGSYAAYWAGSPIVPADIDVFATSKPDAVQILYNLGLKGHSYFTGDTIAHTYHRNSGRLPVQVLCPDPAWEKFPDDIMDSFDFTLSRAVIIEDRRIICDNDVGDMWIKIIRIRSPLKTMKHVLKYTERGAKVDDWELLKVMRAWQEMPKDRQEEILAEAELERLNSMPGESDYLWDANDYWEGE